VGDPGDRFEIGDDAAWIGQALDEDRLSALRKFSGLSGSTKMTFQSNFLKLRPNCVIEPP
jgi:hypothetical protein